MKWNMISPFIWIIALGASIAVAEKPVPVGLQKQLFVDDYVVAEKRNVTSELGKVKKIGVSPYKHTFWSMSFAPRDII